MKVKIKIKKGTQSSRRRRKERKENSYRNRCFRDYERLKTQDQDQKNVSRRARKDRRGKDQKHLTADFTDDAD